MNISKKQTALIDDNNNIILYDELNAFSQKMKMYVEGERNLIILLCSNTIGSVMGYVSFLENRNVPILLSSEIEIQSLTTLIKIYRPQYIYAPDDFNITDLKSTIMIKEYNYQLLKLNYPKEQMDKNLALLLTTSGSTGSPKLVRQSYKNIQSNTKSIIEYLKIDDTERPITTLPMNYTYGLSIINSHLQAGATILLTKYAVTQRQFWEFFKEQKATSFGGVPYTYEILKKLKFFKMELPSLRYMTQAGGKIRPELHKEYAVYAREQGKQFVVMYGQTEATARMSYLPPEKALEKCGSMGIAIPDGKLWIRDENGNEIIKPDVVGELIYEGDNVTLGYAENRDDLSRKDERNGVLETGDMAYRDSDGFYYIVGRKKRFLKIYGNRINLDETERILKEKFNETEFACIGRDDCLKICFAGNTNKKDICDYLSEKTGLYAKAFSAIKVNEIPKNESGKTLYKKLESKYELQ